MVNALEHPVEFKTTFNLKLLFKSVTFAASICKFSHYLLLAESAFVRSELGGARVGEVGVKSIEATEAEKPGMSVK